jgi:peptidoglycan hydrolase-like protein with peptidoglycan-binding domain
MNNDPSSVFGAPFLPPMRTYTDPLTGRMTDLRAADAAAAAMPRGDAPVNVRAIQCALAARGAAIEVDGYYGPQTRTYLDSALQGFRAQGGTGSYERDARKNATSIMLSAAFGDWLFARAPECRARTQQPTPNRGGSTPTRSASTASSDAIAPSVSRPFWRMDNALAWVVVVGALGGIGGVAYYGTKKGWFR